MNPDSPVDTRPHPGPHPHPVTRPRRGALRRPCRVATARRLFLSLLCLSLVGVLASPASADGWAYDLAGELMSPFCPGRTLSSCPSPQAAELVQWISIQEAAGVSRDEVIEILVAQWGEEILGAPPAEGITLWAYIFPVVGIVGGALIALLVIRQLVGVKQGVPAPAVASATASQSPSSHSVSRPVDEELERIVQQELASRG